MSSHLDGDCTDPQKSDAREDERDGPAQRIRKMLCSVKPDEAEHGNDRGEQQRPALKAATLGAKGDNPAMMTMRLLCAEVLMISF